MRTQRSYIICTTMRSGSTMLASGLRETGVAGRPDEHFAPPVRLPQAQVFEMDPTRYRELLMEHRRQHPASTVIEQVLAAGATENGIFGTKIHFQRPFSDFHNAVEILQEYFDDRLSSPHELLSRAFPRLSYIWLRRVDRVAQAVSLYRAIRTSEFVRVAGATDPVGSVDIDDFDFGAIRRFVTWLQSGDDAWRAFFKRHKLQPLVIEYETLAEAYEPTLRAVLDYLGLPRDVTIGATRHRKQGDEISARWVARYRQLEALANNAGSATGRAVPGSASASA